MDDQTTLRTRPNLRVFLAEPMLNSYLEYIQITTRENSLSSAMIHCRLPPNFIQTRQLLAKKVAMSAER